VGHPVFGLQVDKQGNLLIDPDSFILGALKDLPTLDSANSQIVMRDLYETTYGIYDHTRKDKSPFSSVLFHDVEDSYIGTLLEKDIESYKTHRIGEIFRLSLLEFLNLPSPVAEMLIRSASKETSKKNNQLSDLEKELSKM
jgi:hypothetical protein